VSVATFLGRAAGLSVLTSAFLLLLAFLGLLLKKAAETAVENEYRSWAPRVARFLTRIAGCICPTRRNVFWADLLYRQIVDKETGLTEAVSCLVASPRLMAYDALRFAWTLIRLILRFACGVFVWAGNAVQYLAISPFRFLRLWPTVRAGMEKRVKSFAEAVVHRCLRSKASIIVLRATPTAATFLTAFLVLRDQLVAAAAVLTFACFSEFFDGIGAKDDLSSRRAVLIDYIADRVCDIALFGSVAVWASSRNGGLAVASVTIIVLSLFGSYVRAETMAMGIEMHDLIAARSERLIGLLGSLWLGAAGTPKLMAAGIVLTLIVTAVSVGERLMFVFRAPLNINLAIAESWDAQKFIPKPAKFDTERPDETAERVTLRRDLPGSDRHERPPRPIPPK
jgi:hypothetical protein